MWLARCALFAFFVLLPGSALSWTDYTIDAALGATASDPAVASHVEAATMGRLRASLEGGFDDSYTSLASLRWEAAYEVVGFAFEQSANPQSGGVFAAALPTLRVVKLEYELSSGSHHFVGQNLDRLSLTHTATSGAGTLTVGRQAVGHGSGRFFNPSDIFSPVAPQRVYSEYKSGIDGARFTRQVGEDSEWEVYAFFHDHAEDSYALARGRTKLGAVDVSGYAGQTLGAATVALDLAADWLGAGWYLDGVARLDRPLDRAARVALGSHYRLPCGVNGFVELHFNGPGQKKVENAWKTLTTPEGRNGELFLTARRYLAVEADYELHPLVTVAAVAVLNLDDSSLLLQPTLSWSATEKISVAFGASVGIGEGPDHFGLARSEFGNYPDLLFVEARTAF
jgi:hypothetical protein